MRGPANRHAGEGDDAADAAVRQNQSTVGNVKNPSSNANPGCIKVVDTFRSLIEILVVLQIDPRGEARPHRPLVPGYCIDRFAVLVPGLPIKPATARSRMP
jgi:hypothetical protein